MLKLLNFGQASQMLLQRAEGNWHLLSLSTDYRMHKSRTREGMPSVLHAMLLTQRHDCQSYVYGTLSAVDVGYD